MEMVELVVHWVEHGDLAHADLDEHATAPMGADEHGCTGTFHLCSCHTANVLPPSVITTNDAWMRVSHPACPDVASRDGEGPSSPPIRPPIA